MYQEIGDKKRGRKFLPLRLNAHNNMNGITANA